MSKLTKNILRWQKGADAQVITAREINIDGCLIAWFLMENNINNK